jgi:crossover junction endodeoxyribonuclease RuvC
MANEPVKKRIIGIDPGYAITGYGIIDKSAVPVP